MGHDAREPPGEDAVAVLQHRTPLQEDHLPTDEVHLTGRKDITQQHVPRGPHLAGQAFPGERDVLRTGGRPRSLGKIRRPAGPKHVALSVGDALDVAAKVFVRTKGDALTILPVTADVPETVLPPESRIGRGGEKTGEQLLLGFDRMGGKTVRAADLTAGKGCSKILFHRSRSFAYIPKLM